MRRTTACDDNWLLLIRILKTGFSRYPFRIAKTSIPTHTAKGSLCQSGIRWHITTKNAEANAKKAKAVMMPTICIYRSCLAKTRARSASLGRYVGENSPTS